MCAASVYPEPGSNSLVFGIYIFYYINLLFVFYTCFRSSLSFDSWIIFSITLVVLLCYYRLVLKGYCLLFNVLLLIAEHVLYFSTAHYILSILFWNFFKVFLFIFLCCFLSFFAELFDILTPFFHLVNIFFNFFWKDFLGVLNVDFFVSREYYFNTIIALCQHFFAGIFF